MWCYGYFDFDLPQPLKSTHIGLGSASKLDLFGFQSIMEKYLYYSEETDDKRNLYAVSPNTESYDFVIMAGPVLLFFFMYPVIVLVVLLFLRFGPKIKACRNMKLRMECRNFAFFNYPLRLLFLGSTPVLTAIMVHSVKGVAASAFTKFLMGLFLLILIISIPLSFIFLF